MRHTAQLNLVVILAIMLVLVAGTLLPAGNARAESEPKVVYHADFSDPRRFSAMLTSINNMVTYYQNELIEYDVPGVGRSRTAFMPLMCL